MMESSSRDLKSWVAKVPVSLLAAPPAVDVPHGLRCGGGSPTGLEEATLPRPRPMAAALGGGGGGLETPIGGLGAPESELFKPTGIAEPGRLSNGLSLVPSSTAVSDDPTPSALSLFQRSYSSWRNFLRSDLVMSVWGFLPSIYVCNVYVFFQSLYGFLRLVFWLLLKKL